MQYTIVIERGESSFGATIPDLPGCVAVAEDRDEVIRLIRESIELHLAGMKEEGLTVPQPSSSSEVIEVAGLAVRESPQEADPRDEPA